MINLLHTNSGIFFFIIIFKIWKISFCYFYFFLIIAQTWNSIAIPSKIANASLEILSVQFSSILFQTFFKFPQRDITDTITCKQFITHLLFIFLQLCQKQRFDSNYYYFFKYFHTCETFLWNHMTTSFFHRKISSVNVRKTLFWSFYCKR